MVTVGIDDSSFDVQSVLRVCGGEEASAAGGAARRSRSRGQGQAINLHIVRDLVGSIL